MRKLDTFPEFRLEASPDITSYAFCESQQIIGEGEGGVGLAEQQTSAGITSQHAICC